MKISLPKNRGGALFFFPHHNNRFFWALVGADTAPFAELKIDCELLIDRGVGAIGGTEPAFIALLPVHDRTEDPPCTGLPCCPLDRPAHRKALALCRWCNALISV